MPEDEGHKRRGPADPVHGSPSGPAPAMTHQRVLIVDDNEDVRHILRIRLQSAGFDVGGAADGAEGLEQLRQAKWDLVVLDLLMPRMDGFEFLSHLKEMPSSKPPVLVITQRDDAETRQRALALGAAHYVPKGHAFSREFLSTVRRWMAPPPPKEPPSKAPDLRLAEPETKPEPAEAKPEEPEIQREELKTEPEQAPTKTEELKAFSEPETKPEGPGKLREEPEAES